MPKQAVWKTLTGLAGLEGHWLKTKHFTPAVLEQLAQHIEACEKEHTGELVLAIEAVSPSHEPDSRARALEVFGRLRVWDTPLNTGVLLYLALDRHHIEIVADRGVQVDSAQWERVCVQLEHDFRQKRFGAGLAAAIDAIEALMRVHTPALPEGQARTDTLPNRPTLL